MRCLVQNAPFTREELLARNITPEAADELIDFARRLADKRTLRDAGLHPVDQDRFGRGEGNCWAAAVATLTGLPLALLTTELGHGEGLDEPEHWYDRAQRVLRAHGWELAYDTSEAPAGYAIYSGVSPRGLRHSTVGCDGRIVHDPHPSRAGLSSVDGYFTLTPITSGRAALTPPEAP